MAHLPPKGGLHVGLLWSALDSHPSTVRFRVDCTDWHPKLILDAGPLPGRSCAAW